MRDSPPLVCGVGVCLHVLGVGRTHVCADKWMCFCVCACCAFACVCVAWAFVCTYVHLCVGVYIFVWMCVMCSFGAIEMTGWLKLMSKRRKMTFYLFIFKKSSINYLQGCETRGFWPIALNQDEWKEFRPICNCVFTWWKQSKS